MFGGRVNHRSDFNMATKSFVLHCTILILSISSIFAFKPVDVKVDFYNQTSSPGFKVLLSGVEWFRNGALRIRNGGETWITSNNEKNFLKLIDKSDETGEDILGEFDSTKYVRTFLWVH